MNEVSLSARFPLHTPYIPLQWHTFFWWNF